MKKLRAFTLIEVLVSMAISGIVVSASYFCFNVVSGQFHTYRSVNGSNMDVVLFRSLLEQDISSSSFMKAKSDFELELWDASRSITYAFEQEHIIRRQVNAADSFRLRTGSLQLLFEGQKPSSGSRLINEVSFTAQFPDTICVMNFLKEYDPGIMMKQQQTEILF